MAEVDFAEDTPAAAERLVVDLEGYEGPIDVLLTLAREQKVDLTRISILALVDQYIAFVERARALRLEIAADYLVMAAWLAYLKSRLLLPEPPREDEPTAEAMAAALALQLRRLEAMREAGRRLMARPLLGRDVFARGVPEGVADIARPVVSATLYDLLAAYADQRRRREPAPLALPVREIDSMEKALVRLSGLIGGRPGWQTLASFLPADLGPGIAGRASVAATFAAGLELARRGDLELRQAAPFAPVYLRARERRP